jgi:hypothetical protein
MGRGAGRRDGRRARAGAALLAAGLALAAPGRAGAHGDHGAAPPGVVVIAPRAEGRAGPVEIVAEFAGGMLAVFLSRFADGAPVGGVRLEASSDLQAATLEQSDAGVYVTREILFADGRNDITVAFTLDGVARTAPLTLMLPAPHPVAAAAPPALPQSLALPLRRWWRPVGIGGGVALLGAAAFALLRRIRRPVPLDAGMA